MRKGNHIGCFTLGQRVHRHSGESRNPVFKPFFKERLKAWIPAFAGMTTSFFTCFVLIFFNSPLRAEPQITARVSSNDITINDSITLTIEISGVSNINTAPNPTIPNFSVQDAGQRQSYQWINGQASAQIAYDYVLTPLNTGSFEIPSITLTYEGKSFTTQPISITVRPAPSAPPQTGGGTEAPSSRPVAVPSEGLKPLFISAKVDNHNAYVGQQIHLTIQFLRQPNVRILSQPRYTAPEMTGFIIEPLPQQQFSTTIQGIPYDVIELRYALFPTSDGEFTIGSATIDLAVQGQASAYNFDSFFEQFFGRSQPVKLTTRAIPIQVRALPKVKPALFSGAVGRYKITAKTEEASKEFEVGKPFNLMVTIEGVGNIKSVKEPAIPEMTSFRRYESISSSKVNNEGKFIHGVKEFKILLIPQVSGQLSIPAIPFTFFNPETNQYGTETSREISLNVKPGTLAQGPVDTLPHQVPGQVGEGVKVVEKDIRYMKSGKLSPVEKPLYERGGFILFNALPPLFALGAFLTVWRTQKRRIYAPHYRSREALGKARKTLKKASKLMNAADPVPFYGALYSAVADFIADKLDISSTGMIWEDVDRRLSEKAVGENLRRMARDLWEEADQVRFAASAFTDKTREESLKNAQTLLTRLNEVL
ncbi:MAG: BatD family protein [Elusimicrobia bacterium]|nr:BatD family protein [Candidatus Obscuribacterium magneticum]